MTTAFDTAVLALSPLMYLICDETSGTIAADSASGGSHPGTIVGSVALADPPVMPLGSGSFGLSDETEYVTVPGTGNWMSLSAWTAIIWGRVGSTDPGDFQVILSRDSDVARGWTLQVQEGVPVLSNKAGGDYPVSGVMAAGDPYMFALAVSGNAVKLYQGKTQVLSFNDSNVSAAAGNRLTIGIAQFGSGSNYYAGSVRAVDHVAYFGSRLSAADIATIFDASSPDVVVAGEAFGSAFTALSGSVVDLPVDGEAFAASLVMLDGAAQDNIRVGADTSNVLSGLSVRASASVRVTVPVALPAAETDRVDKARALPNPTIVNGRPT